MTSGEERNSYIKERNVASGTIKDIIKIDYIFVGVLQNMSWNVTNVNVTKETRNSI